jgi:hypothetical protein
LRNDSGAYWVFLPPLNNPHRGDWDAFDNLNWPTLII